jgi:hypothetical protein
VVSYLTLHTYIKAAHRIISITIKTKAANHLVVLLPPTQTPAAAAAV